MWGVSDTRLNKWMVKNCILCTHVILQSHLSHHQTVLVLTVAMLEPSHPLRLDYRDLPLPRKQLHHQTCLSSPLQVQLVLLFPWQQWLARRHLRVAEKAPLFCKMDSSDCLAFPHAIPCTLNTTISVHCPKLTLHPCLPITTQNMTIKFGWAVISSDYTILHYYILFFFFFFLACGLLPW